MGENKKNLKIICQWIIESNANNNVVTLWENENILFGHELMLNTNIMKSATYYKS